MLEMIFANKLLQEKLISSLLEKSSAAGVKKIYIDMEKTPLEIKPIDENSDFVLVERTTFNYYKEFFENNKHLINQ